MKPFTNVCSEGGCEESLATHGVVAGLWSAAYSLGEVLGPMAGGLLLEHYGFPVASTFIAAVNLVLVIASAIYFPCKNRCQNEKDMKIINEQLDKGVQGSWKNGGDLKNVIT